MYRIVDYTSSKLVFPILLEKLRNFGYIDDNTDYYHVSDVIIILNMYKILYWVLGRQRYIVIHCDDILNFYIQIEKQNLRKIGFEHNMFREIIEQIESLCNTMRGLLNIAYSNVKLIDFNAVVREFCDNSLIIITYGKNYYVAMVCPKYTRGINLC
jgi:hypothetical protein